MTTLTCVVALAPAAFGVGGPSAVVGRAVGGGGPTQSTTTSTKHVVTTTRVDLVPAPASECGFPGSDPVLVEETSVALDPVLSTTTTFGPATIYVGEDELQEFFVAAGTANTNTRTTYETVVTQYFQAVEPGPPCAVVLAVRFTG
ncbi:MAG: hypothetical protein FJW95_08015 [Actinobacteria bacterium]|nr:hypothetical protein [Actinomycetota bacterium]